MLWNSRYVFRVAATAVAIAAVLALAAPAAAETIRITSGALTIAAGSFGPASIDVAGDRGFTFSSVLDRMGSADPRACGQWEPCGPGTSVSLGATWSGLDLRSGVATLEGITYPQVGGANSPNQLRFDLAGLAPMPPFGTNAQVVVRSPFTLTGGFWYAPAMTGPGSMANLLGEGTVTLDLSRGTGDLGDTWVYQGIRYDFEGDATPVPEPATLLLVGGGIAGLVVRARKRRCDRTARS